MLVAVAAASPATTSLSLTKPWANAPASMVRRKNRPAILAVKRGDACDIPLEHTRSGVESSFCFCGYFPTTRIENESGIIGPWAAPLPAAGGVVGAGAGS